ncbi:MAG TPA: nucleotidyltransferase domain-containing protein [Chloroflexota bacterium]
MAAVIEQSPSPQSSSRPERLPRAALKAFCARWRLSYLAFFGSVLRDDFGPKSDIDVIVDFEAGHVPGIEFVSLTDELEAILGRRVDVITRAGLKAAPASPVKSRIQQTAQTFHGR